jgi:hypothetical protein
MDKIRVIVAEGQEGSAAPGGLLRAVLEQEGVEVAGEVLTVSELIELAADEQPDAVVFATRAPQADLDRLRSVAPASKIVFVSPILIAAEAELAEAVVERADVLASLGPVLVHLCTPGRMNARRALTESFDRPDWIDRVRKDPVTLREILSESPRDEGADRPSVTSLQGEARAADPAGILSGEVDLVHLPDLEAAAALDPVDARSRTDVPRSDEPIVILPMAQDRKERRNTNRNTNRNAKGNTSWSRSRRRLGLWSLALIILGLSSLAVLPSTVPAALEGASGDTVALPPADGPGTTDPGGEGTQRPRRNPTGSDLDLALTGPAGLDGSGTNGDEHQGGDGTGGGGGDVPAPGDHQGGGTGGGTDGGTQDTFGSSAEHNPHGGPPGHSGEHPEPGGPQLA